MRMDGMATSFGQLNILQVRAVPAHRERCRGVCSEAKDQVEQLSNVKECILVSVLLWCCGRHIYGHDQGLFT
jgi:hypothetical protein